MGVEKGDVHQTFGTECLGDDVVGDFLCFECGWDEAPGHHPFVICERFGLRLERTNDVRTSFAIAQVGSARHLQPPDRVRVAVDQAGGDHRIRKLFDDGLWKLLVQRFERADCGDDTLLNRNGVAVAMLGYNVGCADESGLGHLCSWGVLRCRGCCLSGGAVVRLPDAATAGWCGAPVC